MIVTVQAFVVSEQPWDDTWRKGHRMDRIIARLEIGRANWRAMWDHHWEADD